jgi:thiosulfate reductase cytochrome b subunit
MAAPAAGGSMAVPDRHAPWVRVSHWIAALSLAALAVSGAVILMAHPRLYWGEVGNDLTPALLELPISRNYRHAGYQPATPVSRDPRGPVSASRTFEIFNQNGWARSLHFLAAWLLVLPGVVYLAAGLAGGHFRAHLWPSRAELGRDAIGRSIRDHLRLRVPPPTGGPHYNVLQKLAYSAIVLVVVPLMALTGLAMSPAVSASYPLLPRLFGGFQSARTLHFGLFAIVVLFAVVHVVMVAKSGFRRQLRAMTLGEP